FPPPGGVPPTPGDGVAVEAGALLAFTDGAGALVTVTQHDRQRPVLHQCRTELLFLRHTEILAVIERGDGLHFGRLHPTGLFDALARLEGTRAWIGAWPGNPSETGYLLTRPTPTTVRAYSLAMPGVRDYLANHGAEPDTVPADDEILGFGLVDHMAAPITWNPRRNAVRHLGTNVTVSPARTPESLTVSPDGKVVAWHTPEGFLEAWSLVTGDPLLLRYGPS
ncbi:MAG: hypothetical protein ACK4YP_24425, partial [Myxococcota bacterium]